MGNRSKKNPTGEEIVMAKIPGGGEGKKTPSVSGPEVSRQQWLTMAVLVFVNLINYMDRLTLAGVLDQVKQEFDLNDARAGILQTAFIISYMLFAPVFGYLGDRYSRKYLMATGVLLWSVLTFLGSLISGHPSNQGKGWAHPEFLLFLSCRAMIGIGEASYSTIAPTLISDMFVGDLRSKMLALFYFAIPVGSGLGYIVGSETAKAMGSWHWGLRVTPGLGVAAVLLIIFLVNEPPRGASDGHGGLEAGSYKEDLTNLAGNPTYILTTFGFTCVTFCTGALAWWGPLYIERGLKTLAEEERPLDPTSVPFIFGLVTMLSGIVGVPLGMLLSTKLRAVYPRADPIICGAGILISALFLTLGIILCDSHVVLALVLIFLARSETLNLNWSIVPDMVDEIYSVMIPNSPCKEDQQQIPMKSNVTQGGLEGKGFFNGGFFTSKDQTSECENPEELFTSLQYSFFSNSGVEVLGGILFLASAIFIVNDRLACEKATEQSKGINL